MDALRAVWSDYTLVNVLLGCAVLGLVSGVLGSFAVLRRQGLMGDAMAHCALPGVCLAYMVTGGQKTPIVLMIGAALAGWVGMLLILAATRYAKVDIGTALAVILTVFFGWGIVLLTRIQQGNDANQAGLDKFLFGQAATLVAEQVATMGILGGGALLLIGLFYKEFKLLTFDPEFAGGAGLPTNGLANLLTGLLVVAVVIGLNTVGVVLMSAMLVAPAAGARQWTNRLGPMIGLSALAGGLSGVAGAWVSAENARTPTGPVIVLALSAFVAISLLFGSARGLLWTLRRRALVPPEAILP